MATRYEHSGNAAPTTLSTSITNVSTSINITSGSGWPSGSVGPFWVTIDAGTASEEKVLCASRSGTVLTVTTRGADGTTATAHASGAAIIHSFSATEADDANALAASVTTAGGAAVTTTGTQTLTNKTLTSPVITGSSGSVVTTTATQTLTGKTVALGSNTVSGTLAQLSAAVTDDDVAGVGAAQTLTNKDLSAASNTFPASIPRGTLTGGYLEVTAAQNGILAVTNLTGLSSTVTVGSGRRVKITGYAPVRQTTTSGVVTLRIRESGTTLNRDSSTLVASETDGIQAVAVITPSAGSHTYTLSLETTAGTVNLEPAADNAAFILVQDIGV